MISVSAARNASGAFERRRHAGGLSRSSAPRAPGSARAARDSLLANPLKRFLLIAALCAACGGDDEAPILLPPTEDGEQVDAALDATIEDTAVLPDVPAPIDTPKPPPDPGPPPVDPGPPPVDAAEKGDARVIGVTIKSGPTAGGTETVVICDGYEIDFRDVLPTVTFAGADATALKALSRGVVRVTTPAGPAGPAKIVVKAGAESASLDGAFTYSDELPKDAVVVKIGGGVEPSGVKLTIPVTLEVTGSALPAAIYLLVKHDPALLPLAAPTYVAGDVAAKAGKELTVNLKKPDGVRLLLLGKNRNAIGSGTIVTFFYPVPPTDVKWAISPLYVTAKAVDAFGATVPTVVQDGFVGVAP